MKFKTGDRVVSVHIADGSDRFGFVAGDTATVLTVADGVAWIYPDRWREHVPREYEHRNYNGLPHLRFLFRQLKLQSCMFEEVVPIK